MAIRKRQTPEGTRFYAYAKEGGRQSYVGAFGSNRDAVEALEEHRVTQRKIAAGELPPEVDLARTLAAAVAEWLESLARRSARSHEGYTDRMKLYILPALGKVPIAKITASHVMRWRDDLAARLAPATVNGNLTCLSSAFTYFVKRQWIEKNPCHGVERIERPEGVYHWLKTREEITRLLLQCPGDVRDIVAVAVGTGMRLDEVLHLQWGDIDIERRLIAVHRGRKGTVKSGKARRIPILDVLLPTLRDRALRRDGALLVFPAPARSSALPGARRDAFAARTQAGVRDAYKLAVKRAGLEPNLRFHDLRHTFASHWVLDGGDIFRLSKVLGHSSVVITQKFYAHLAPEAWEQDYHRVSFKIPAEAAVYRFERDVRGRLVDRVLG
jgi:integrase